MENQPRKKSIGLRLDAHWSIEVTEGHVSLAGGSNGAGPARGRGC
ncbi:MAG TPA: hypothetical protein VFB12_01515 [Ktedonobacteraceae bacterium]|nr:hypothetical protein [Ktedonobacteraceae bacterium]